VRHIAIRLGVGAREWTATNRRSPSVPPVTTSAGMVIEVSTVVRTDPRRSATSTVTPWTSATPGRVDDCAW